MMENVRKELKLNETIIRPRFCEIDSLKVAHHSKYIPWIEEANFNFVERVIGISRKELFNLDMYNPIHKLECTYKNGVKWDDTVVISSHMHYSTFAYFIMENKLISYDNPKIVFAEANIKYIFSNKELKLKIMVPKFFFQRVEEVASKYPDFFTHIQDAK